MLYHGWALMEEECLMQIDPSLENLSFKTSSDYEGFWDTAKNSFIVFSIYMVGLEGWT